MDVRRSFAAKRENSTAWAGAGRSKMTAKGEVEKGRRDSFGGKAENDRWQKHADFRAGLSRSCGSGDHEGRRTKLDFSSRKPFDDRVGPPHLGRAKADLWVRPPVGLRCRAEQIKQSGKVVARFRLARGRSFGCARNLPGAGAVGSGAELIER